MSNKDLVVAFVEAMRISGVEKLQSMITGNFSWWIAGRPDYLQTAAEHGKDFIPGFFGGGAAMFPEGAGYRLTGMIAQRDRVGADAHPTVETAMGNTYDNGYHLPIVIEDRRIKRVRENMDTHNVIAVCGL